MKILKFVNILLLILTVYFLCCLIFFLGQNNNVFTYIDIYYDYTDFFIDRKIIFIMSFFFPILFFLKVILCVVIKLLKKHTDKNELIEKIIFRNLILIGVYFFAVVFYFIYGLTHIQFNFG